MLGCLPHLETGVLELRLVLLLLRLRLLALRHELLRLETCDELALLHLLAFLEVHPRDGKRQVEDGPEEAE